MWVRRSNACASSAAKKSWRPFAMFDGTIGIASDPQGAVFALFAGEVDP